MLSTVAWEAAIAQGAPPLGLQAVRLIYLPVWCCSYTYLGMPLDAFVCGRTGLAAGISQRGLGRNFWDRAEQISPDLMERAGQALQMEQQLARVTQGESTRVLMQVAGVGAARAFSLGARALARHPKVALALAVAPVAYSFLKPLAMSVLREAMRARERQRQPSSSPSDLDSRADWEELIRRGEERRQQDEGGGASGSAANGAGSDARRRSRKVDLSDPRSVLGLPATGRISRRQLDSAFRRELLLFHPDHYPDSPEAAAKRTQAILAAYHRLKTTRAN